MKIEYFPDTDSLYIDLVDRPGADSIQIADGVVLDVDSDGHPVGIDIDEASRHLDLQKLDVKSLPLEIPGIRK